MGVWPCTLDFTQDYAEFSYFLSLWPHGCVWGAALVLLTWFDVWYWLEFQKRRLCEMRNMLSLPFVMGMCHLKPCCCALRSAFSQIHSHNSLEIETLHMCTFRFMIQEAYAADSSLLKVMCIFNPEWDYLISCLHMMQTSCMSIQLVKKKKKRGFVHWK